MTRKRRRRPAPGTAPGTIVVDPGAKKPILRLFSYDGTGIEEMPETDVSSIRKILGRRSVTWVNVDGLGDADTILALGEVFGLHRLSLEDVASLHQRPKVEDYGQVLYLVARMGSAGERYESEQISFFLGSNFVVTFQENPGDCFDPVRERIRRGKGQIRTAGASYLAYALLDALLDHYFPILERLGDRIEELEREILDHPGSTVLARIHAVRRDLLHVRRDVWPVRDALGVLLRDATPLIPPETRLWFRDLQDHAFQIMDMTETSREMTAGLVEAHMSSVGNRMNEVMKVLTMIATIFIPLTFIAGVYGMNFRVMPEIEWTWGYPFSLGLMGIIAFGLVVWFRRKGWLGGH
ncbi:MAG: magnesium/cobalt transporter CorA [Planctomycetes bacterium]|jgi:magnesium transporter|nr:magnesium/cobalt transporter CorA [Planctomycetota bacterium]